MLNCKECGGTMSPKTITYKGQPKQIFECDQANGPCKNEKGYPTSYWPKNGGEDVRQRAAESVARGRQRTGSGGPSIQAARATPTAPNGNDNRSNRIERQHSQEMAIRTVDILMVAGLISSPEELKEKIKDLTNYYQRDIGREPAKPESTQQAAEFRPPDGQDYADQEQPF